MEPQSALSILARLDVITFEEWYKLVELRKQMIKKSLREMTLKTLGEIRLLHDYFGTHDLNRDNPDVFSYIVNDLSLSTRGIFPKDDNWASVATVEYEREGGLLATATTHRFWGLTRDAQWIAVEVYSTIAQEPYKYEGRTEQVQRAITVHIRPVMTVDVLCEFSKRKPQDIWERLGGVVREWVGARRQLLDTALQLEKQVLVEEAILGTLPTK